MNTARKKVGLIGCGTVAMYGHLPAIKETEGLELFAICDPHRPALEKAQKQFDVPHAFTDAGEFFRSGIEAVTITSPAPFHEQNCLDACKAGLPILCEKPLAMDSASAARMIAAAERANVSLHTAFCYRFSPSAIKIKELVAAGAIGKVRSLRLIYNWGCHGKYAIDETGQRIIQARREGRMLEGGPMVDCGTHQIDLASFWLDSPVTKFIGHGAWVEDYDAPDHVWVHMDHANGAHTVVEISYSYHHTAKNRESEFVYELIGTDGVIRYDGNKQLFKMETAAGRQDFEYYDAKSFVGMYREWCHAMATGQSSLLPDGRTGQRVIEIAREATNQAIRSRRS